jgi:DNA-binding NarL/FixJ family response regulator
MSPRIMIAEDQTMVRQALVALLELEPDIHVVAEAAVADRLHLSPGTVRNHLSAAIQKLGARNRADAARIAKEKGWL